MLAQASISLQLLGTVWTLLGQVVAVETLVFVLLRPRLLRKLHALLSSGSYTLGQALRDMGLLHKSLSIRECIITVSCPIIEHKRAATLMSAQTDS